MESGDAGVWTALERVRSYRKATTQTSEQGAADAGAGAATGGLRRDSGYINGGGYLSAGGRGNLFQIPADAGHVRFLSLPPV